MLRTKLVVIVILLGAFSASTALAQSCASCPCDSVRQYQHIPGVFGTRVFVTTPDGQRGEEIQNRNVPAYYFEYQMDSCDLTIAFAQFTVNRRLVALHAHCYGRHWNWNDSASQYINTISEAGLADISRTRWFVASAGDTVGFHRRWLLREHATGNILTNYWHAPVSLSYSVELVDSADGQRMMLLDTFRISATTGANVPSFFTMYPSDCRIRQTLPATVGSNRTVAIRMRVYSTPLEPQHWTRSDIISWSPTEVGKQWYMGTWKVLSAVNAEGRNGTCAPFVNTVSGGCAVSPVSTADVTTVVFTRPDGTDIASMRAPSSTTFQSLTTGAYIVSQRTSAGAVVCTNLVYVN